MDLMDCVLLLLKGGEMGMPRRFKPGDPVIYRKQKYSVHPGPNAKNIWPSSGGDYYTYSVDKYYRVIEVPDINTIVVLTRRGRQRVLNSGDPALRRINFFERLFFRHRFPHSPQLSARNPGTSPIVVDQND